MDKFNARGSPKRIFLPLAYLNSLSNSKHYFKYTNGIIRHQFYFLNFDKFRC